jgi:hypothetical protein
MKIQQFSLVVSTTFRKIAYKDQDAPSKIAGDGFGPSLQIVFWTVLAQNVLNPQTAACMTQLNSCSLKIRASHSIT